MAAEPIQLAQSVCVHAWNADRSKIAFSPCNNEIHIWARSGDGWNLEHILKEHEESQMVTGIDWAPKTNRLVTSAQDRNAYVWSLQADGSWKPTLVILRITRAATDVKWSPSETKFAVSSGAKCVAVCYFEQDNDWWVSKHIKSHKSTVTKIDWHPNSVLLATSSTDFKARVFSTFVKGVDTKPAETPFGAKLPFGELLAEYQSGGWVQSVRWSPSGKRLAFVSHDSTTHFVDAPTNQQDVRLSGLPLLDLIFTSEDSVIAVGHDCNPYEFKNTGGTWAFTRLVDQGAVAKKQGGESAMNIFKAKVETGQVTNATTLNTKHQNTITCIRSLGVVNGATKEYSTTGLDGKLIIWKV